ncbi:uncharacterized protein LOC143693437 [Agelaius phoeniceus]|uniref:uncharacterized protein LOC143693437 n=1 Tax=Agelaius phoeniceus TaxID=39638 RepID=UPI00405512E0
MKSPGPGRAGPRRGRAGAGGARRGCGGAEPLGSRAATAILPRSRPLRPLHRPPAFPPPRSASDTGETRRSRQTFRVSQGARFPDRRAHREQASGGNPAAVPRRPGGPARRTGMDAQMDGWWMSAASEQ